ncbi:MAG: Nramp family divalent metal transporter, partial [Pirellulales bacterium]
MSTSTPPSDLSPPAASSIQEPPHTIRGILGKLGPGLIIAGSIVGSGELIGTTITGASAGFWLMWLIVVGCVIKVFVQVEFGRYTIVNGKTTIAGLSSVPGPMIELSPSGRAGARTIRANWLVWYWIAMFLVSLGQLGGIVGGVGQAMAISIPLTEEGRRANEMQDLRVRHRVETATLATLRERAASGERDSELTARLETETANVAELDRQLAAAGKIPVESQDTALWAVIITALTAVLLMVGRYQLIEIVSTFLVAGFTAVTIFNVLALQLNPDWAVTWQDIVNGMSFQLPPRQPEATRSPLAIALAT